MAIIDVTVLGVVIGVSVSSILIAIVVALLVYWCVSRLRSELPPFPATPIPIFGNLFSVKKDPRAQFSQWRKKHGDIFSLYFGSNLTVVLNGIDTVKEALEMEVFSNRPNISSFTTLLRGKGIVSTSGSTWRSQRSFSVNALKECGFGRNDMEDRIIEELKHVLDFVERKKGMKHDFAELLNISTYNVVSLMVFGHRFEYEDENFLAASEALNTAVTIFTKLKILNPFPFLAKIPGSPLKVENFFKNVDFFEEQLMKPEIKQHYDAYDGTTPDFLAAYIKEMKNRERVGIDTSELQENLQQNLTDFFIAGTGTIETALKWLFLYLIHNPEVQEKCFQEIQDNIGPDRLATLNDRQALPYLQATIAEALRRSNLVPFSVAHAAAEDTKFKGYNIPKGTIVMINVDSVSMDPQQWPEPEKFRPERFLDKFGAYVEPEAFIPFSTGRRGCVGQTLAKMELFLFSAALIQKNRFLPPEDEPMPTLEPTIGSAAVPVPYRMRAVQRESRMESVQECSTAKEI